MTDFSPTAEVLSQHQGDISVIIDFDQSGEKVVNYQSLSPSWQITNVSTVNSTTPSWTGQDESSIKLLIEGTTDNIKTKIRAKPKSKASSLNDTKQLMELVTSRNDQLKNLLHKQQQQQQLLAEAQRGA